MIFDKMVAICLDFKWLGYQISDPIWNLNHLQTNLYFDTSGFQMFKLDLFQLQVIGCFTDRLCDWWFE